MSKKIYLHGYTSIEQQRLLDQSSFLEKMIYKNINFSKCRHVIEIGCGVGAHLKILLLKYPELKVTGIDVDSRQIQKAKENLRDPIFKGRYSLLVADAATIQLDKEELPDGALFCWVLEHVNNAIEILKNIRQQLRPKSPIYITEVYNKGWFIQPQLPNIMRYWQAYNQLQKESGGDIVAGVKLGYYLKSAEFKNIKVQPIGQFHDSRNPERRAIMASYLCQLFLSGSEQLLASKLITNDLIEKIKEEFEQLKSLDEAIIFYPGFQASAKS